MEANSVEGFPYTPLGTTTPTVRLLRLQKDISGSIVGELEAFSLDNTDCPSFITLSYVWGAKESSHAISINGYPFPILDSLYTILKAICDNEQLKKDPWWIDFICINQAEGEEAEMERNAQVQMMKRIYQTSYKTVGWLGHGKEDGEDGFKLLRALIKHKDRLDRRREKELGEELSDRKGWAAVERLLLRPWWTRVWTLQEYIVPPNFVFYCGKESMDRDSLKVATYAIYLCRVIDHTLISAKAFAGAWIRRRLLMWYREGFSILYRERPPMQLLGLLAYVADYEATDPRDRIYSLLGLAQDRCLADPPRYQDDIGKIYSELVLSFVKYYNSLDVICLTDRFNRDKVKSATTLPSWVPDWRAKVEPAVVPSMASQSAGRHIGNLRPVREIGGNAISYAAGRVDSPLQVIFSDDLRTLTCHGVMVDCIDGMGGLRPFRRDDDDNGEVEDKVYECIDSTSLFNITKAPAATRTPFSQKVRNNMKQGHTYELIESITLCLVLNRTDRYLSYEAPTGYLCDDFLALCLAAVKTPTEVHGLFLDWYQRNRSLHIQGYSIEERCKATMALKESGYGKLKRFFKASKVVDLKDISDEDSFLSRFKDTTGYMARRLITTNDGHIGMGPCRAQKGDQIWVLLGCSIPMVLRRREGTQSYEVIGECYLHGYMNGEVMDDLRRGAVEVENVQLL